MRPLTVLISLTWTLAGIGQADIMLLNGTMHVSSGTTLAFIDTVHWQFTPGSSLVNDGLIDLGQEAMLNELPGAPVTGSGIERSHVPLDMTALNVEPGGLGLNLDIPETEGDLTVTRGHQARAGGNGVEGVSRWYFLGSTALSAVPLAVAMWIDGTELNGLQSGQLALHASSTADGPWEELLTTVGPGDELEATLPGTGLYLTAFDPDLITAIPTQNVPAGHRVWPSLVDDVVHVVVVNDDPSLFDLEVLDATGRTLVRQRPATGSTTTTLDLHHLAPGGYLIRVNKATAYRIVRP